MTKRMKIGKRKMVELIDLTEENEEMSKKVEKKKEKKESKKKVKVWFVKIYQRSSERLHEFQTPHGETWNDFFHDGQFLAVENGFSKFSRRSFNQSTCAKKRFIVLSKAHIFRFWTSLYLNFKESYDFFKIRPLLSRFSGINEFAA